MRVRDVARARKGVPDPAPRWSHVEGGVFSDRKRPAAYVSNTPPENKRTASFEPAHHAQCLPAITTFLASVLCVCRVAS